MWLHCQSANERRAGECTVLRVDAATVEADFSGEQEELTVERRLDGRRRRELHNDGIAVAPVAEPGMASPCSARMRKPLARPQKQ
jgi:hypothetical protein